VDGLFFDYRDPIFGIMIFVFLIFIVSFITYSFGVYKERKSRKEYRKLLKRFELGSLKEDDYVHLYTTYNLPFDSIVLLASSFIHKGDYNKAISVYLALLEHVDDRVKKEELLELLGKTYLKSGFLQRAKDIFLKVLKFSPRNQTVLKYLLIVYEKLKDYDGMDDVIGVLDTIGLDMEDEKLYVKTLKIINSSTESYEKRAEQLEVILKDNNLTYKMISIFWLQFKKPFFWQNIDKFNILNIIDILWYLNFDDVDFDVVQNNKLLNDIYNAKGYIDTIEHSDIFELDVLITLGKDSSNSKADLSFDFICSKCKINHPVFDTRCPHCHSILTLSVQPQLTRSYGYEANSYL
jgi:tetratricopeptide (TPR) repeat protein